MSGLFYYLLGILTMATSKLWWPFIRSILISKLIASEEESKKKKTKKPKKKKT
jgi:hypothetical protein